MLFHHVHFDPLTALVHGDCQGSILQNKHEKQLFHFQNKTKSEIENNYFRHEIAIFVLANKIFWLFWNFCINTPAWLLDDVICINKAICWRSDIGVFWLDLDEPVDAPEKLLGLDVDGIAFTFLKINQKYWKIRFEMNKNLVWFGVKILT